MKKGVFIILDGYGEGKPNQFNAVANANTPYLKSLKKGSYSLLKTDGEAVGLFKGDMGGSEVGHMTLGAGRIIPSTQKKIQDDFSSGNFKKNPKLTKFFENLQKNHANLHLIGLMSDKNVHSNIHHAFNIIEMANGFANHIFLHLFTDGRDTPPHDSLKYIKQVKTFIKKYKNCEIASLGGRGYGMDREGNWDRTELAFNSMFNPKKTIKPSEIENYLKSEHDRGENDQFVAPVHVCTVADSSPSKNDILFFFNSREDRLRQITKRCEALGVKMISMARVETSKTVELYPSPFAKNTLSEYISKLGLSQIKISETTKYAHVTYYLNGGREQPFENEDRIHVPTKKVEDFATTPKMRAGEIASEAVKAIEKGYDAIFINFSNPDMIGHTGNYEAVVEALEFLDKCVKKVAEFARKHDYFVLITADHGNAEEMRTADGQPHMAHTLNRVFCAALGHEQYKMAKYGELSDVAPTFAYLMGLKPNRAFEGKNLIVGQN